MRILFILGLYRPGKCGISDYVRLLIEQLELLGHGCSMININSGIESSLDKITESLLKCDVVSLQFAPYSFHPKGLPGKELQMLGKALAGYHLHVMFHEIWIGAYPNATFYERWIGKCQREQIIRFLTIAKPYAIQATNSAALDRLNQMGINASYLYLFGNIPWAKDHLSKIHSDRLIKVAFFGTPYSSFPYDLLVNKLNKEFIELKKEWKIKVIGNIRDNKGLKKLVKVAGKCGIIVEETGMIETEEVSYELQSANYGVATTPYDVLGKSGSVAAMLEHRLPVYVYDDGDTPSKKIITFVPFRNQIFILNKRVDMEGAIKALKKERKNFFNGVVYTTDKFLEAMR